MDTATNPGSLASPLSQPVHDLVLPQGSPPWRDNAFLLFWDPTAEVYGSAHVSTSPNGAGNRARFSLSVAGELFEVVEALEPHSFAGPSLSFDVVNNAVQVYAADLLGALELRPRFEFADYAASGIFPSLVGSGPMHHYQQGVSVVGEIRAGGRTISVNASGLRDRTWGFRDEALSMQEYVALVASFPDHTLTVMRILSADGSDRTEGYKLSSTREPITGFAVTRDASGFLVEASLSGSSEGFDVTVTSQRAGLWVPMGAVRRGPAIRAYDEFVALRTSDGQEGFGVVEQALVHRLF